MTPFLHVTALQKRFAAELVLENLELRLERGRTLSALGRSGSGKTTLLKIIAGLEPCDAGEVRLDGEDLTHVEPQRRNVVYLGQEPLLFPHLDVFENVAFGLRLRKQPQRQIREKTAAMLQELGLSAHARKMAHEVSGGQRQRAAFGRALIIEPRLLLLDEPFGALDAETRASMQELFKRVVRAQQIASIFVTHDLKEALLVGERFAYLSNGRLDAYDDVAAFLGNAQVGALDEIRFWEQQARALRSTVSRDRHRNARSGRDRPRSRD